MKKCFLSIVILSVIALSALGQNEPNLPDKAAEKKQCCFRISSLSLLSGFNGYRKMGDYEKHMNLHMDNQNQYGPHSGNMGNMNVNGANNQHQRDYIMLEMGLQPYSKKLGDYNKKRELIIGIYYSGSDLDNWKSEDFTSIPGDTFTYNTAMYQTDTVTRTQRTYREKASVLGASVQYLYMTDPEKRFSIYTGYGLDAAFTIDSRIDQTLTTEDAVMVSYFNAQPGYEGFDDGNKISSLKQEVHMNADKTIFTSIFVPMGVNLRLCKKKEIWNQMNLFLKGNLGLEAEIQLKHKVHFNPYMGCSLGFRFDLK